MRGSPESAGGRNGTVIDQGDISDVRSKLESINEWKSSFVLGSKENDKSQNFAQYYMLYQQLLDR